MKTILILSLMPKWIGISRLPKALKDEEFDVITLSPANSYLSKTRYSDFSYTFRNQLELRKLFLKIIKKHDINYVIPGGDFAVSYFNQIVEKKVFFNNRLKKIQKVIRFSYSYEGANMLRNKSKLQEIAYKNGIKSPLNRIVKNLVEVMEESRHRYFPMVLKSDLGVAGAGVRICNNGQELKQNFLELNSNKPKNTLLYIVKNKIKRYFLFPILSIDYNISLQNYIIGKACMCGVFCSNGKVLSSVTMAKEQTYPDETSPSSVIRVIEHEEIKQSVEKLIKITNYSGFASFDFILDCKENAYLLECNTRPTPITHICRLMGGNLIAMIKTHMGIKHDNPPYLKCRHYIIALYPNEQKRDAKSVYIRNNYYDVPPKDDTELIKHILNSE